MDEQNKKQFLDELENECQKIHQKAENERPKDKIYHYTNFDSLVKILESRTIQHTDYRYFNDPMEIKFGQNLILEAVTDSDIPHKEEFTKVIDRVFDIFNNQCNMYVSCYATTIDKLALWRYYANNSSGFAICFNEKYQKINTSETDSLLGKSIISQVIYGHENGIEEINKFIQVYQDILARARNTVSNGDFLIELDKRLISHLISILPILKDESFSDENEIRIYWQEGELLIDPDTGEPFYFPDEQKDFIKVEDKKIPFVNYIAGNKPVLYPEQFDHSAISEIWVGPSCEFNEAQKSLRELLSQYGYNDNVVIRCSTLPYRNG